MILIKKDVTQKVIVKIYLNSSKVIVSTQKVIVSTQKVIVSTQKVIVSTQKVIVRVVIPLKSRVYEP